MKIGVCASIDQIGKVETMGFDYIEPSVVSIMGMDDGSFEDCAAKVKASSIKCESFNILLLGGLKVAGPEVDLGKLQEYFSAAFARVARLGGNIVVFGSGGARSCPEGWSHERAVSQFEEACRAGGEAASAYGVTIAVEPLNKRECNVINKVSEGFGFVKRVDHPNVKLLADFYHMRMENEAMGGIIMASDALRHLHIANSHGRGFPLSEGEDDYAAFRDAIRGIGYEGRLSIEGGTKDFDTDAPAALAFLRRLVG